MDDNWLPKQIFFGRPKGIQHPHQRVGGSDLWSTRLEVHGAEWVCWLWSRPPWLNGNQTSWPEDSTTSSCQERSSSTSNQTPVPVCHSSKALVSASSATRGSSNLNVGAATFVSSNRGCDDDVYVCVCAQDPNLMKILHTVTRNICLPCLTSLILDVNNSER